MTSALIGDIVTELVALVDAYHRALDELGGNPSPALCDELALRHGRVQVAMRCETEWSGFERDPEAVAA